MLKCQFDFIKISCKCFFEVSQMIEQCDISQMIEQCDDRLGDAVEELVEMVAEVLPPPPTEVASEEVTNEADQETGKKETYKEQQNNKGKEKTAE